MASLNINRFEIFALKSARSLWNQTKNIQQCWLITDQCLTVWVLRVFKTTTANLSNREVKSVSWVDNCTDVEPSSFLVWADAELFRVHRLAAPAAVKGRRWQGTLGTFVASHHMTWRITLSNSLRPQRPRLLRRGTVAAVCSLVLVERRVGLVLRRFLTNALLVDWFRRRSLSGYDSCLHRRTFLHTVILPEHWLILDVFLRFEGLQVCPVLFDVLPPLIFRRSSPIVFSVQLDCLFFHGRLLRCQLHLVVSAGSKVSNGFEPTSIEIIIIQNQLQLILK